MIEFRTPQWYKARIGKFTASGFPQLMSKPADKTASVSKSALNCIEKSAAELFYNQYYERPDSDSTRWGMNQEKKAILEFSKRINMETADIGFMEHPLISSVGATPDARVIDSANPDSLIIAQIKCPYNTQNHIDYMNKIYDTESLKRKKSAFFWQIQGEMWVTDALHSYFVSYDPRLSGSNDYLHIVKVERDEEAIHRLENVIHDAILLRNKILDDFNNRIRFPKPLRDYY